MGLWGNPLQLPRFSTFTLTLTRVEHVAMQSPSSGLRSGQDAVPVRVMTKLSVPVCPRSSYVTVTDPPLPTVQVPTLLEQLVTPTVGVPPHGHVKRWNAERSTVMWSRRLEPWPEHVALAVAEPEPDPDGRHFGVQVLPAPAWTVRAEIVGATHAAAPAAAAVLRADRRSRPRPSSFVDI